MRLGRIILAGLAPFFGLSAIAAGWMTGTGPSLSSGQIAGSFLAGSLPHLLSVVPFAIAVDQSPARPSPHQPGSHSFFLSLKALASTPFQSSLWLLASALGVNLFFRRHACAPLRC
jgi:hypothetical protein